jgi:iron uptake system component EfeO
VGGDDNLFDADGVTGIHALERILWSDQIRPEVMSFEAGLTGYKAAAFPRTKQEAEDFKSKLVQRLLTEVTSLREMFKPLALDPAAAYRGVIGSLGEQVEKITKAESGEEESRYANLTLADMRYNVEGGQATHAAFRPWLLSMPDGAALDGKISAGFARITAAYGTGTTLPPLPATWNETKPSEADLATPFGLLFGLLSKESDDKNPDSLVTAMNQAATAMGIKTLP